jgi:hypothetical protein
MLVSNNKGRGVGNDDDWECQAAFGINKGEVIE